MAIPQEKLEQDVYSPHLNGLIANSSLENLGRELERESRSRLQLLEYLVATSPMALYICRLGGDYGATFVSEGARTLWGYDPEEFLRDSRFWVDHIHPEDRDRVLKGLGTLLEQDRYSHEYRFRTKSGEYRWTYDELRLVRDSAGRPFEMVGHCIDITERKQAEMALRESRARLDLVFNGTSDLQSLYRVEPGGRFVLETANRSLIERFKSGTHLNLTDFIGKDYEEILAATGLTGSQIEERKALFQQVVQDWTQVQFVSPQTPRREAVEMTLSPVVDQAGVCTHVLSNGRLISDRLRAEAALKETTERYQLVVEATHDGVFDRDIASHRVYYSPRYKEMLGFRDDELPDNNWASFFERIHPDDRSRLKSGVASQDRTRLEFADEFRLRHKDGTYRWVASRGRLLRDAEGKLTRVVGAVQDTTERHRAAEKLAASEKRLRDILDSQFGFVGLYNLDGTVAYVNRAPLEAAGIQAEDVLGKPLWETPWWCHSSEEQTRIREVMAKAAGGEVVRFESRRMVKGGQQIVVDATFGPLRDQQGAICNVIGFGVDVTKRKEVEEELSRAIQVAEAASRAKSEFLANMSHEIRTPMNGIIGLSEVLLDSELRPEHREYLNLVKSSAESLLKIVSAILDMAKIQSGKYVVKSKEYWLREVVESAAREAAAAAKHKKLRFISRLESKLPAVVLGDPDCLRQVVSELLDNAVKFTSAGQVELLAKASADNPELLQFTVRDTGTGVSAEQQQMIFEPFSQVDGSSRRQHGGTGLGLAISAQLVEMMGGRMWVESDGQSGSAFHFTILLPAVKVTDPAPPERAPELRMPAVPALAGPHSDRRRHPRFATNDPATLESVRPFSSFPLDVRVVDISKSGLRLSARESIDAGTIVRVRFQDLTVTAEVRYCVPVGNEFHTGIKFQDGE